MQDRAAVEAYKSALYTFNMRWKGEPSAPKKVRQVFKQDEEIRRRVTQVLQERGQMSSNKTLRKRVLSQLFEEYSNKPCGLDRYLHLVEMDHDRYACKFQAFKETMNTFDRDNGLLPRVPFNTVSQ